MSETDDYPRREIDACARCTATEAPYAYLHDGRHYCVRCARVMLVQNKIRPIGRRADDLTLEDVLWRELPDTRFPDASTG